ncbi:MAG: LCP family protein [Nitriliruptoraceae bacterium]
MLRGRDRRAHGVRDEAGADAVVEQADTSGVAGADAAIEQADTSGVAGADAAVEQAGARGERGVARGEGDTDRGGRRDRRVARRAAMRHRRRGWSIAAAITLLLLLAAVLALLTGGVLDRELLAGTWLERLWPGTSAPSDGEPEDPGGSPPPDRSALVVGTSGAGDVRWLAVLASAQSSSTVLLMPASLVVDVPELGPLPLDEAASLGGAASLVGALADELGVRFDTTVEVSTAGWGEVVASVDGIEVTLRAEVEDTERGIRLAPGPHRLDATSVQAVLEPAGTPLGERENLARVAPVLAGILDALAADPTLHDEVAALLAREPVGTTPADAVAELAEVLDGLAAAREADELAILTLPVVPVDDGSAAGFRVDEERAEPILRERLAPWRPGAELGGGQDVQILNGNGVPRIAQQVTDRLANGGYRVVLTGNADRFTHERTRIILHADTPEQVAVGRDVQRRLGVGELELAATPSSVVDVTILVGHDFPPAADP